MSYARPSAESDIYLYESVEGGWVCLGCPLSDDGETQTETRQATAQHVRDHIAAGHKVGGALNQLEAEIAAESTR